MVADTEDIVRILKRLVDNGDVTAIAEAVQDIPFHELPMDYIILKVYLHACLKKQREIAEWIFNQAENRLDPIQMIAIRQMASYGRRLLESTNNH